MLLPSILYFATLLGSGFELHWTAPPSCPQSDQIEATVERFLGRTGAPRPRIAVDATVQKTAQGYTLTLALDGPDPAERRLESPDCQVLADATALIIAVALDPMAAAEVATSEPEERPAAKTEPKQPEPSVAESSADSRGPPKDVRFGLRPYVGAGFGLLPGVGIGTGLALATFGRKRWRAELYGAYWFPRTTEIDDRPGIGGEFWLVGTGVRGCLVLGPEPVSFPLCLGPEFGILGGRGRGEGIDPQRNADLWIGFNFAPMATWSPHPRIALFLAAEALVSARRPAFHLEGVGPVYRVRAGGGRATFGVEVRFP